MESVPLISIVIPVYGAESFLPICVDSILSQRFNRFELILIDDGSPDRCPLICDDYAKKDSRIRVIHKRNTGVSAARNDGIKVSSGKYIMFVDSDDLLPQEALEKYLSYMGKDEYDVIFGQYMQDYRGKKVFRRPRLSAGEYSFCDIRDRVIDDGTITGFLFGSVCGCLYKRKIIIDNNLWFDEDVHVNEDGLFNLKFVNQCGKICVINDYVYVYRQWKFFKDKRLIRDVRFDKCEEVLENYIVSLGTDFELQLKRRKISILFWNAIRIRESKCKWKQAKVFLQGLFLNKELSENFKTLDYLKMNMYKRVLCRYLRKHRFFSFYILTKYFAPLLQKVVKR